MPCPPEGRLNSSLDMSRPEAGEVMSGILEIVRPPVSQDTIPSMQRVFVRVYQTSNEHFAVLYPVRALVTACRPLTSINLKSCVLEQSAPNEFRVAPRAFDGVSLTFRTPHPANKASHAVDEWLAAFSADNSKHGEMNKKRRMSEHRRLLPALLEREEEEEHGI